jgi:hypothetical protein
VGLAVNAVGVGQAPAPAPEALTVIARLEDPSETVTVPPANAAEGEARTLLLPETAV